jgi:MoaE protein
MAHESLTASHPTTPKSWSLVAYTLKLTPRPGPVGTRRCPLSIFRPSTKSPSSASNSPISHGGTTRNNNEGRKVIALDYEAYPEMAEKELTRLGEEARRSGRSAGWPSSTE